MGGKELEYTRSMLCVCTGVDLLGREVVVFVGKMYPAAKVTENQVGFGTVSQITCQSHACHMLVT